MDVSRISEVIAEVKENWHLLPSWKAHIPDSDAGCGQGSESRLIRGRVLLLGKCEEIQSTRVLDLENKDAKYELEDVEVKAVVVKNSQRNALDKQTDDLHRRRSHLLERLRSENANMETELGRRRAQLMPCRINIENIPPPTRRLFDTSVRDSVAKRLPETKQSWMNAQSSCGSESAFRNGRSACTNRLNSWSRSKPN